MEFVLKEIYLYLFHFYNLFNNAVKSIRDSLISINSEGSFRIKKLTVKIGISLATLARKKMVQIS